MQDTVDHVMQQVYGGAQLSRMHGSNPVKLRNGFRRQSLQTPRIERVARRIRGSKPRMSMRSKVYCYLTIRVHFNLI